MPVEKGHENSLLGFPDIARRTVTCRGENVEEILVLKDPFDVTGAYLAQVRPGLDRRGRLTVEFQLSQAADNCSAN